MAAEEYSGGLRVLFRREDAEAEGNVMGITENKKKSEELEKIAKDIQQKAIDIFYFADLPKTSDGLCVKVGDFIISYYAFNFDLRIYKGDGSVPCYGSNRIFDNGRFQTTDTGWYLEFLKEYKKLL